MRARAIFLILTIGLVVSGLGGGVAGAGHNTDEHSDNVELLTEHAIVIQEDNPDTDENERVVAAGSDLAFQGDLLVAGSYEGIGLFKMRPTKPYLEQISFFPCAGGQGDVGVWGDLVFMSVDSPQANSDCVLPAVAATPAEYGTDGGWEGLRIISIKDLKRPKQVAAIKTPCGSHTHTIAPAGKKLYIYIESYPLSGQGTGCNAVSHRKVSIMEVPLANPSKAKLLDPMATPNTIGCHDITMFPARDLAVAACVSESQVWDVKDPAKPELLATIHNPAIQIHHSTGFTWDGKYLVLGDEFGGAAAGGCVGNSEVPMGAMWFYDISDPTSPEQVGYYAPPRVFEIPNDPEEAQRPRCTTHNFNVVPTKDQSSYIAVTSYYSVALSVVDFSDPTNAKEIGYYLPKESGKNPDSWSAYWYNGLIYTNDHGGGAGIRVFRMKELSSSTAHFFKTRLNPQTQMM